MINSLWRKHLIIYLVLGLLVLPVYFLDRALLSDGASSNWIHLDFRGLIFWTYVTLVGIHVIVSSIAALLLPNAGLLRIHLGSALLALFLFITGFAVYGKLRRLSVGNEYRAMMARRKRLVNVIELNKWWYVPDESHPTEIRVSVVVHQAGRFAGNVSGEQTDSSGSTTIVFESANGPETQRHVRSGDNFIYPFPLKFLNAGKADDVRITLYLLEATSGPATGDIEKVFMKSPQQEDDGEYFYGVLPAPSSESSQ